MTHTGPAVATHRRPARLAALAALALATLAAAPAPAQAASKARKPRVALLDFPAASNAWSCSGWANNEGRMASVLRDLYTSEISDRADGRVRLIERERLNDLRGELNFQQSAEVDGATAQQIGKLLGAQYLITGKITRFGCKKTNASSGWGVGALVGKVTGSGLAGSVAGSVKGNRVSFTGRVDARLIDVRTGEIMGTWKEDGETGDLSVEVAGGGVEVPYDDQLASKVFEPIVAKMAEKMVPKILKAAREREDEDDEAGEEPAPRKKKPAVADADEEGTAPRRKKPAAGEGGAEAAGAGARGGSRGGAGGGAVPEVFGNDFDFVPGEQLLVFDDFSDTEVGDYPARWTLKDGGGGGASEVIESEGRRWFYQRKAPSGSQRTHHAWLRYQVKGDMPAKFTVELDVLTGDKAWYTLKTSGGDVIIFGPEYVKTRYVHVPADPSWNRRQVQHLSIAVNGTSLKAYLGGRRIVNDPDAVARPLTRLGMAFGTSYENPYDGVMFTNFRVAEGGKDITQAISAEGRFVTHGITFDSGSDRIRPESGPTLRKLLKLLQDDGAMGFEIIGHTDNQGGDKVNGPLSERRAAAVKAWLVAQGIEDGRLATGGAGATKPLKGNDTPEGRAENRRVEFVRRGG